MSRVPTLAEVLNAAIERGAVELRVALPGEIQSFDPATQLASVKPLLREGFENEDGSTGSESLPVVNNVPVQFCGGGGFAATWPVTQGDACLLVFTDRSMDRWKSSGGDVDPIDVRRHDLSDAVAILGVRPKPGALSEFDSSRAVFGNKGPRVACDGSAVHLGVGNGASATEAVLKGDTYSTNESTMLTALSAQFDTAGASLIAAALLNAIPIVGGALAAAAFLTAGTALSALAAPIATFQGTSALNKSLTVKTA